MNRNHFIRFGLDKESADILFNSLRSFGESTSEGALISEARTIRRLKSLTTVAIIGTAGRDNTGTMTMNLWMKMCERAQDIILNEFQLHQHQVELISGGAACAGESMQLPHTFSFIIVLVDRSCGSLSFPTSKLL
jgi:hypothetical protein